MKSHELAKILLTLSDLPIATVGTSGCYSSIHNSVSHGSFKIGKMNFGCAGGERSDHLILGCLLSVHKPPNFTLEEILFKEDK